MSVTAQNLGRTTQRKKLKLKWLVPFLVLTVSTIIVLQSGLFSGNNFARNPDQPFDPEKGTGKVSVSDKVKIDGQSADATISVTIKPVIQNNITRCGISYQVEAHWPRANNNRIFREDLPDSLAGKCDPERLKVQLDSFFEKLLKKIESEYGRNAVPNWNPRLEALKPLYQSARSKLGV